jgi:multiple inositol-polyphosphate phosphatase / 2,3-bisphosphoglycerate 3-phosphatase
MFRLVLTVVIPLNSLAVVDLSTKSPYLAPKYVQNSYEGCEPIFYSALARHGSRTATSESKYLYVQSYLQEAFAIDSLTHTGEQVLAWSKSLHTKLEANNISWGGLTSIGKLEHHTLGARMFSRFPNIFDSASKVLVDATQVQRTQDSRDAYIEGMISRGANPNIFRIQPPPTCNSTSVFEYSTLRFYDTCSSYVSFAEDNPLAQQVDEVSANYTAAPIHDIHNLLFTPSFIETKSKDEKSEFVNLLYSASCATQADTEMSYHEICSPITPDAAEALSYVADLGEYIENGPLIDYPIVYEMTCPLFSSLLRDLLVAVGRAEGDHKAHIRFAHAETTLPLLAAFGLVTEDPFIWAGGDISRREFRGRHIASMASNLNLVVYDCEGSEAWEEQGDRFRVELLQDEATKRLPFCDEDLCSWEKVKSFVESRACSLSELEQRCGGLVCPSNR